MSKATEAFEIASGSSFTGTNELIKGVFFAILLVVFAYIILKLFDEVKEGKLTLNKMGNIVIRMAILYVILGYFLLH